MKRQVIPSHTMLAETVPGLVLHWETMYKDNARQLMNQDTSFLRLQKQTKKGRHLKLASFVYKVLIYKRQNKKML